MPLHPASQKIQDHLSASGYTDPVLVMPDTTRTAEEAAAACGCSVAEIGKSLLFATKSDMRPVLIVASGVNRVDEKKVARLVGDKIVRPDAAFVKRVTGFVIGGVPPICHTTPPETFLDQDLFELPVLWCAAGTPNAVFKTTADALLTLTGGTVADVRKD